MTGPPAAGKTTVARAVAREARLPVFAKDDVKEALFDSLGIGDRQWSRRLGVASIATVFDLADRQLAAGLSVLVEANFSRTHDTGRFATLASHRALQVHVSAPREVLFARDDARIRHPGHRLATRDELRRALDAGEHEPLGLAGELVALDTAALDASELGRIVALVPTDAPPFDPPLLIVVTGPPATGKTQVAEELAERLRIPFISKDTLKERLYEEFGSGDGIEERIDRAALAILFAVVDSQLEAGVSVVAESNFDRETDTAPFRRLSDEHALRLVQIHCHASRDAILATFAERAGSGRRHPGHEDEPEDATEVGAKLDAGLWDALDLPGELVELPVLETEVDFDALAERVRALAQM